MATNIARLNVSIVGNGKALRVDLKQNEAALRRFDKTARGSGKSLGGFFQVFAGNVAARAFTRTLSSITSGFRALGRAAIEFDESFQKSIAIQTSLGPKQIEALRDAAISTSFDVKASANEIAEGFFFLASAGQSAEQQLQSIGFAAKFAQAGAFDLARAVDLLTDAQSALGLVRGDALENLNQLERVGDVLVKANTLANASVEQFSTSLTTKAGPALRGLRIEIEEGVAILAAFADQGVKDALAGTQLSIVLRDLTTKALLNRNAFAAQGIAVFDSAGEFRRFADILSDIEKRISTLSDAAQKQFFLDLGFSDKSLASLQTLLGTSDKIRGFEKSLNAAGGTVELVSENQFTAFARATNEMKASFDAFGASLGRNSNLIQPFAKDVSNLLRNVTSLTESFNKSGVRVKPGLGGKGFFELLGEGLTLEAAQLLRFTPLGLVLGKDLIDGVEQSILKEDLVLPTFSGKERDKLNALRQARLESEIKSQIAVPELDFPLDETQPERLRRLLGEDVTAQLERQADILRNQLLTPAEKFREEFEKLSELRGIEAFGADTEEFFGRALERAKKDFVDASIALQKDADRITRQQRQSFVTATERGSIGELASRIQGLDAAIAGASRRVPPEDERRNALLAQIDRKLDDLLSAQEDEADGDVRLEIAQVTLP